MNKPRKSADDEIVSDPEEAMRRLRQGVRHIVASGKPSPNPSRPKNYFKQSIQQLKRQRGN
jgi:hypothetical protein